MAWFRMYSVAPLPGVSPDRFQHVMRTAVVPAVNSGSTRGGQVTSVSLYKTSVGHYRWIVEVDTVGGGLSQLPGFAAARFDNALEKLVEAGVVYAADDLELVDTAPRD